MFVDFFAQVNLIFPRVMCKAYILVALYCFVSLATRCANKTCGLQITDNNPRQIIFISWLASTDVHGRCRVDGRVNYDGLTD